MQLYTEIKQVFKGFAARKGRTFLTMLGIIIGVAGVVIIVSLGAGAQQLVVGQVTKLGTNLIGILPGKSDESGPPAAVFGVQIKTLSMQDVLAISDTSRVPYASAVAPFVQGSATVISGRESVDTKFTATLGSYPRVQTVPIKEGRFFTDEEGVAGTNVIVLGATVSEDLFPNDNALGAIVKIKQVPFRVIGVLEKQGTVFFQNQDDQVIIPLIIGQRQILGISYLQFIRVKVSDPLRVKATMEDIKTVLREEHNIRDIPDGDDFSVRDLADAIKILTNITDGLRLFLSVMASISLVVGGIGIMNIMLVTVSERTREIGLRKALGATARAIRNQFLIEAVALTLMGGLIGIFFGSLVSYGIALGARFAGYDWAFVISPVAVISAVVVSMIVGIGFGLYPARKAAKLDPIEALRYE